MGNMSVESRHAIILEQLLNGPITVADIAQRSKVSEITIRRDLSELEQLGYLKRTHGGAISVNSRNTVVPLALRKTRNQERKRAIAKAASTMLCDGECVALDTGSTVLEMTDCMDHVNTLTVLTTSMYIAMELIKNPKVRVVLPGGVMEDMEGTLAGELTVRTLQEFNVDKFFMCVGALDVDNGLTEHGLEDAQIKSVLLSCAKEVILLVDSSKFDTVAFKKVCYFDAIDKIVTDELPSKKYLDAFHAANVEVFVATEGVMQKV